MTSIKMDYVGIVHSCYKEKFAIPRQAGLVKSATASIELLVPYNHPDIIKGLEGFSHLWISFIFHKNAKKGWKNLVSPPRAEGMRYGVFATRSPFRPNPLGLSVVELESIESNKNSVILHIKGADFLDKTPVIDIKPYIAYSDALENTSSGFVSNVVNPNFKIAYTQLAKQQIAAAKLSYPNIENFIAELLLIDHRPIYQKKIKNSFHVKVYDYDLSWEIEEEQLKVVSLEFAHS